MSLTLTRNLSETFSPCDQTSDSNRSGCMSLWTRHQSLLPPKYNLASPSPNARYSARPQSLCRLSIDNSSTCISRSSTACRAVLTAQELSYFNVTPSIKKVYAAYEVSSPPSEGVDLGWSTNLEQHYRINRPLGQGSFGVVHEGTKLSSGMPVAIKVMPKIRGKSSVETSLSKLLREVSMLEQLQACCNTVRLDGLFEDDQNVQIVMEVCRGGDLQEHVQDHGPLDETKLSAVAIEVLKVISFCHDKGILHGDIKPANFCLKHYNLNPLFSDDEELKAVPWLKAVDLGCSQRIPESQRFKRRSGTPVYMAPEVYRRDFGKAADMWSLGVMLYWLFVRRFPFYEDAAVVKATGKDAIADAIANAPIPYDFGAWKAMSGHGVDFISRCLCRDEEQRLTVTQAMQHPWLQEPFIASCSFDH